MKKNIIFLLILVLELCFAPNAYTSANAISDNLRYNEVNAKLTNIANLLKKDSISSQTLEDDITYLREKRVQLENSKAEIENDIRFVEKRAEALGEMPEDGNEIKLITEKRKEIKKRISSRASSFIRSKFITGENR